MEENLDREIVWGIYEYSHSEKSVDWYWALGIIAIAMFVSTIIFHDFLFGVLILIASSMFAYLSIRKPNIIKVTVNDKDITINETVYPYKKLRSFYIDTDIAEPHLLLVSDRFFMPLIAIPIHDVDPESLHAILADHIKEQEMHEPQSHKIMEFLGI